MAVVHPAAATLADPAARADVVPTSVTPVAAVEVLNRFTVDVEAALRADAPAPDSPLTRMASYHVGWIEADGRPADAGGKHLRSNLCCWAAAACGADPGSALPAACTIELIHNFTLAHDDVQDGDAIRRGRATVWSLWGAGQAINVGDYLFARACQTMLAGAEQVSAPDRVRRIAAAQVVLEAVVEVIHGQTTDLGDEGHPELGRDRYLQMVEAKTGALMGASLEAGAVIAGASGEVRRRLRRAGRRLGVAFQLRDDWLGVWGEVDLTGKSRRSDLARRKLTYPAVLAHELAGSRRRARLVSLYRSRGEQAEPEIRAIFDQLGIAELTAQEAAAHAQRAVAEVRRQLSLHSEEEFADVAQYVAQRNS
jgi:geranylgeranyl diphosphate synthase type I